MGSDARPAILAALGLACWASAAAFYGLHGRPPVSARAAREGPAPAARPLRRPAAVKSPVAVPLVVGQRAEPAAAALRRLGLRVRLDPAPSAGPAGVVTAQAPLGGGVPHGTLVALDVATR